jgi:hypothetical protein
MSISAFEHKRYHDKNVATKTEPINYEIMLAE